MHSMFGGNAYQVAMIQRCRSLLFHLLFTFIPFVFATQLFSIPVTSLNLRNQAPLFTELCLLQAITRYNTWCSTVLHYSTVLNVALKCRHIHW